MSALAPGDRKNRAAQNFSTLRAWREAGDRLGVQQALTEIWAERQWESLGYESFRDACRAIVGDLPQLERDARRETVAELTQQGMSTRAIADTLGVSDFTVRQDQKSGAINLAPEVRGNDGKTYPRNPITPEMAQAAEDLLPSDPYAGWSAAERDALEAFQATGRSITVSMSGNAILGFRLWQWAEANGVAVRIDRKTKWGNPFVMPEDGQRDQVIEAFARHYLPNKPSLIAALPELRGMILGCWCTPMPCHGDALIAEAYK